MYIFCTVYRRGFLVAFDTDSAVCAGQFHVSFSCCVMCMYSRAITVTMVHCNYGEYIIILPCGMLINAYVHSMLRLLYQ